MGGLWEYRVEDEDDCDSAFGALVGDVQGLCAVIGVVELFSSVCASIYRRSKRWADDVKTCAFDESKTLIDRVFGRLRLSSG